MQKSTLPVGVKNLYKYYKENKTLDFDCPIQRASGQWNNLTASLLIHSMLSDYIIPSIYFRKEVKDGTNFYSVLEGKQRLTNLFSFIDDEWMLHAKTPSIIVDGVKYDLALKKFSDLEEDLKNDILGYRFSIYQIENATDEEIEELFARLNAGTPLSKIQQARPKMGMELADWCNKLTATPFFQKSLNMTVAQLRREDEFLCLLTTMMLLEDRYFGHFKIKTSASAGECVRFAEHMKINGYSDEKKETVGLLVEYLNEAFGDSEYKFLRKNNIPIVMYVALIAFNKGIAAEAYKNCVVDFFEDDCTTAYLEASGSGNVKLVNVNIRLMELLKALIKSFPSDFEGEGDIPTDFIKEKEEEEENSEENSDEVTSDESTSEEQENYYVECTLSFDGDVEDKEIIIEVDSTDEEYLNELCDEKLHEYAQALGVEPNDYSWKIREDMTKEEYDALDSDDIVKFVLFNLSTDNVGQEATEVYALTNTNEDYLNELGHDLAKNNAEMYGIKPDENFEEEPFSYTFKVIEDMTREEIEEEYGEILTL